MSVDKLQSTSSALEDFDDAELEQLYTWIDSIPLSRPKKNIARDFSDGVLVAEIMHHKFPHLVQKHNYSTANSTSKKMDNWYYLNRKVFKKLNFELSEQLIRDLVDAKPGTIELLLRMLKLKIERAEWELRGRQNPQQWQRAGRKNQNDQPEVDQNMGSPGRRKKGTSPTRAGAYFTRLAENKEVITLDKLSRYQSGRSPVNRQRQEFFTDQPKQKIVRNISEADHVPRLVFEEKVQECLAKDETIKILQAKIHRMEHLIHLKDVRIDDLQSHVESMRPTGNPRR
uniref:Sperm flagellar protein 1-like isoform X10 n=1 Tax=Crassostrea virginica TaxID=6565 RepID=A0A8B8EVT6_CRAVI|nr:sperm flagellar protein 1-like isoform X10 [Crassostrea virginica]XP_022344098.1 sperm flagellar protein 1-like isoform X11 [Crassostrea virginica]XP_022344099.1 sperm flagellar protein 1-like isoform X12 [Crassostrea virginica]